MKRNNFILWLVLLCSTWAAHAAAPKVGETAPELSGTTPDGTPIKLSDLRGRVVLVDFWASWCGPCRAANPDVVLAYKQYISRGFTVFSVSLDVKKDKWMAAIAKDSLSWPYHISDLKGWDSQYAFAYDVMGIPTSYLIDEQGVIVAADPDPINLPKILEGHFHKKVVPVGSVFLNRIVLTGATKYVLSRSEDVVIKKGNGSIIEVEDISNGIYSLKIADGKTYEIEVNTVEDIKIMPDHELYNSLPEFVLSSDTNMVANWNCDVYYTNGYSLVGHRYHSFFQWPEEGRGYYINVMGTVALYILSKDEETGEWMLVKKG